MMQLVECRGKEITPATVIQTVQDTNLSELAGLKH